MNLNTYFASLEQINWNDLSVHIAIKVFRSLTLMLSGLRSFVALLLFALKAMQPTLQMQSQKMTGEMINQPLPSTLLLLLIGLTFAIATWFLGNYWHPRTPFDKPIRA